MLSAAPVVAFAATDVVVLVAVTVAFAVFVVIVAVAAVVMDVGGGNGPRALAPHIMRPYIHAAPLSPVLASVNTRTIHKNNII